MWFGNDINYNGHFIVHYHSSVIKFVFNITHFMAPTKHLITSSNQGNYEVNNTICSWNRNVLLTMWSIASTSEVRKQKKAKKERILNDKLETPMQGKLFVFS